IRQAASGDLEFCQSPVVIKISTIEKFRAGKVRLAGVGSQPESCFDRGLRRSKSSRSMVAAQEIEIVMRVGEQALRGEEGRIAGKGLVEQINCLEQVLPAYGTEARGKNEIFRPAVEIECCYVRGWSLLDRTLLTRGQLSLKLI